MMGSMSLSVAFIALGQLAAGQPAIDKRSEGLLQTLNRFSETAQGVELSNPRHRVQFDAKGVQFTPRQGPAWRWSLQQTNLAGVSMTAVPRRSHGAVEYERGAFIERYIAHVGTIEQQFLIPEPLSLDGQPLIIRGRVQSAGAFRPIPAGWEWRSEAGRVWMGPVTVLDAAGKALKATMTVRHDQTLIIVPAAALAAAAYPVLIDPEIGGDLRLSDMGPDGVGGFEAFAPQVVFNPIQNEYFVVWLGDNDTDFGNGPLADQEEEVYGQRVDAATGAEIGGDIRLSDMGPDGDSSFDASAPQVVFNPIQNEYFVVWIGEDDTDFGNGPLNSEENEVFGQRVDAATGAEIGADIRLSDMGPDGDPEFDVINVSVVFNPIQNEYFVVWQSDDDTDFGNGPLVNSEFEIFGQRVNAASGAEIGGDIRLSDMGPDGNASFDANSPQLVFNSSQNEYFAVWFGSDNTDFGNGPLASLEREIWGQRINAATGAEIGGDLRLSDMGPDGSPFFRADEPRVVYNSTENEYFAVWRGSDDTDFGNGPLVSNEFEIFGQRVNAASGAEIGGDIRLSDMGSDGDSTFGVRFPVLLFNSVQNEYFVVWQGTDNTDFGNGPLGDSEREIFGQRVNAASGAEIGADIRLSDLGPDGNNNFVASSPQAVFNPTLNEYLILWDGNEEFGNGVEEEVFTQRVDGATGAEIGGDLRLSDMGSAGDSAFLAGDPQAAFNPVRNGFLVVWNGSDDTDFGNGPLVSGEIEIFGQLLGFSPDFSKSFAPDSIPLAGASRLTFTIDNSDVGSATTNLAFTDNLPAGVFVNNPSNLANSCGGTATAVAGSGVISLSGGTAPPSGDCSLSVDVSSNTVGTHLNTSSVLTSSIGNSGPASDSLTVSPPPTFAKAFTPDTIVGGGVSTLTFTIDNTASALAAASLAFTDSFPAGVEVAALPNAANSCGGAFTAPAAATAVSLSGGSVAAAATCTLTIDVRAPAGTFVNTSGDLTSTSGNSGTAADTLEALAAGMIVSLTKDFVVPAQPSSSPSQVSSSAVFGSGVLPGGIIDLEYTITNVSALTATGISFSDDLNAALAGLAAVGLPSSDVCGVGSLVSGTSTVSFSGGTLTAASSCTFRVSLRVPPTAAPGTFLSTSSQVTATTAGGAVASPGASAGLAVTFLNFSKDFSGVPVAGSQITLTFTIMNPDSGNAVSDIAFTDDLEAVLPGLTAVGLPAADVCGTGSSLTGTSLVALSGGSLAAGGSCSFAVELQIPFGATPGPVTNETSPITAAVGGATVVGDPATAATAAVTIAAPPIPTLSLWGLLLLTGLLSLAAWRMIGRRGS